MNDRFKFRIWDKKLKKLAKWGDNPYHNMEIMNYICVENPVTDWRHEDYILMQCTGLKDKNGKLIYEGDIVKFAFPELAEEKAWEKSVIVWGDKYKYPAFDIDKCEFECNGLSYIFNEEWVIEVIGNIYENKELLDERN